MDGRNFQNFEQFSRDPNGLGMARETIEKKLTAQQMAQTDGVSGKRLAQGWAWRTGNKKDLAGGPISIKLWF
jgi:hypothetical protein